MSNPAFADVVCILALTWARPSTVCAVKARHFRADMKLWDVEDMYKARLHKKKYVKRIWLLPEAFELVRKRLPSSPLGRSSGTPTGCRGPPTPSAFTCTRCRRSSWPRRGWNGLTTCASMVCDTHS